ncbi:hypothetical protein ACOME3_002764 [Neoechinorhynchus agilis]
MSSCTNKTSKCVNCGGSHRSYYKGCPCLKAYVDAWKKYSEMKRNPNILRTTPSAISHQTRKITATIDAGLPSQPVCNEEELCQKIFDKVLHDATHRISLLFNNLQNQFAQQIQNLLAITIPDAVINSAPLNDNRTT